MSGEMMASRWSRSTLTVVPYVSGMTKALFEDTGWYTVASEMATNAGALVKDVHWGFEQGCEFAINECFENAKPVATSGTAPYFCGTEGLQTCSAHRLEKLQCGMSQYPGDLPLQYQYFPQNVRQGGDLAAEDFCPTYSRWMEGKSCLNKDSTLIGGTDNYMG